MLSIRKSKGRVAFRQHFLDRAWLGDGFEKDQETSIRIRRYYAITE